MENVNVRYRENLPLVLKNINFNIEEKEKIGVVGRTGSGKSTLINTLTRILEIEEQENSKIIIDDLDVTKIGLHHLRKNIEVIPQEPFLIEGTFRENIDPYNKLSDEVIIE